MLAGIETSIAAFVGWAPRGNTEAPTPIGTWEEYVRHFGGLHRDSDVSYSVYHFFQNGGRRAIVVRIYADGSDAPSSASISIPAIPATVMFSVTARNVGQWGEKPCI